MSEKHKILTSMTYFSWSVGSKFDIQLLNAYLQKVVKIDGFRNFEMLCSTKTWHTRPTYVNCFHFLIAFSSSHRRVYITLVLNFDNPQIC